MVLISSQHGRAVISGSYRIETFCTAYYSSVTGGVMLDPVNTEAYCALCAYHTEQCVTPIRGDSAPLKI